MKQNVKKKKKKKLIKTRLVDCGVSWFLENNMDFFNSHGALVRSGQVSTIFELKSVFNYNNCTMKGLRSFSEKVNPIYRTGSA